MASMIRKFKIELALVINCVALGALAPFLHIVNKSLRFRNTVIRINIQHITCA